MRRHRIPALTRNLISALPAMAFLAFLLQAQILAHAADAPKPGTKAAQAKTAQAGGPLLPAVFSGWQSSAATPITDAAQADAANAAALKEYGFTDGTLASYARDDETLKIRALRFTDASGAYGAYSFYRQSGWPKEDAGTGAASDHNRVLFWIGNVIVDSEFSHISAMSGAELRELAANIPVPAGNRALAPPILSSLPQKNLDGQSTHYALGPAGYLGPAGSAAPEGVLPAELVGFDRGAETATASYSLVSGAATLTVINYPTPQLAAAQEKAISAYLKAGNTPQHPWTKLLQDSNPTAVELRRSGPFLALVSGDPIASDAHKLLESVHYEADISALPGQGTNEVQKTAQLVIGLITLVAIMFAAALIVGFSLGSGRALYRHLRGKPLSSVYDEEFIHIDLRD